MLLTRLMAIAGIAAGVACAQNNWEIGGIGGFGVARGLSLKGPAGSATPGLANGAAIGAFGGHDTYEHWSGELRYLYRFSDLKLSSGPTSVTFGAHSHIIHPDFLAHFTPRSSRIRPFIAFGGGVKILEGVGAESAAQPLGRFAALTRTRETLGFADVGAGVKINLLNSLRLRVEVRDYISPKPTKVIAPAPGATIGGALNDIIGSVAISYTF